VLGQFSEELGFDKYINFINKHFLKNNRNFGFRDVDQKSLNVDNLDDSQKKLFFEIFFDDGLEFYGINKFFNEKLSNEKSLNRKYAISDEEAGFLFPLWHASLVEKLNVVHDFYGFIYLY
jgi:hypothetical protein